MVICRRKNLSCIFNRDRHFQLFQRPDNWNFSKAMTLIILFNPLGQKCMFQLHTHERFLYSHATVLISAIKYSQLQRNWPMGLCIHPRLVWLHIGNLIRAFTLCGRCLLILGFRVKDKGFNEIEQTDMLIKVCQDTHTQRLVFSRQGSDVLKPCLRALFCYNGTMQLYFMFQSSNTVTTFSYQVQ